MHYEIEKMNENFTKYHLDFRGEGVQGFQPVIHLFTGADLGCIHDHPFTFTTHILTGGYKERVYTLHENFWSSEEFYRAPGTSHVVDARCIHELIELPAGNCLTVIVPQHKVREPGFWNFDNGISFRRWDEPEFRPVEAMQLTA